MIFTFDNQKTQPEYSQYKDKETGYEIIKISLPGFNSKDISVSISDYDRNNVLVERILKVKATPDSTNLDMDYLVMQIGAKPMSIDFVLKPGSVLAELPIFLKDGILTIKLKSWVEREPVPEEPIFLDLPVE